VVRAFTVPGVVHLGHGVRVPVGVGQPQVARGEFRCRVQGPGVPAGGRPLGWVVINDRGGVGQSEAHDGHRCPSTAAAAAALLVVVRGRAVTVRPGSLLFTCR